MSLHESQSLLIEMQACRSPAVRRLRGAADARRPSAATARPGTPDNLCRLYTRVEPGFIRVDADEVTYPAHVILRYRLERALIAGDLRAGRPAGRLERRHAGAARHRAARRPRRLPAGHPLAERRLGLFPDLHAGRHDRGPALRRRPPRRAGDLPTPSAAATSRRCSPGCAKTSTATAPASPAASCSTQRHRPPARSGGVQAAPGDAVSRLKPKCNSI